MLNVMTIVGTRPELIKMSRVIHEFKLYTSHTLVHTGQNYDYELNQVFFDDLNIQKPDYFLDVVGENASQLIASVIEKTDKVLKAVQPDAVLLYGDTNSCLSVISAKRLKIPIFHMEAGNRCFDQRVPEEINRKIVDHLSDINLVLTEHARRYLLSEGIKPDTIFKTGSHMYEVLNHYMNKIDKSDALSRMKLESQKYFLISAHREENVDSEQNLSDLLLTLNELANTYNFPVIVSTHPRTRKRIDALDSIIINPKIKFMKPFGFTDYIQLQKQALCVISDSGTITEEASILNLPAITIRNAHERPEGMDAGILIMAGLTKDRVMDAVKIILGQYNKKKHTISEVYDYKNLSVSKQVLRIVRSYTEFVKRTVWQNGL